MSAEEKKTLSAFEEPDAFAEPWQAQAFALTVQMHEQGHFSWPEWSEYLGRQVSAAGDSASSSNEGYYRLWLAALEQLLIDKGYVGAAEHAQRQADWDHAARHTPHGQPIELFQDEQGKGMHDHE